MDRSYGPINGNVYLSAIERDERGSEFCGTCLLNTTCKYADGLTVAIRDLLGDKPLERVILNRLEAADGIGLSVDIWPYCCHRLPMEGREYAETETD